MLNFIIFQSKELIFFKSIYFGGVCKKGNMLMQKRGIYYLQYSTTFEVMWYYFLCMVKCNKMILKNAWSLETITDHAHK